MTRKMAETEMLLWQRAERRHSASYERLLCALRRLHRLRRQHHHSPAAAAAAASSVAMATSHVTRHHHSPRPDDHRRLFRLQRSDRQLHLRLRPGEELRRALHVGRHHDRRHRQRRLLHRTVSHDTRCEMRGAVLTSARMPTRVRLICRAEPTTKKWKTEKKLKSKKLLCSEYR